MFYLHLMCILCAFVMILFIAKLTRIASQQYSMLSSTFLCVELVTVCVYLCCVHISHFVAVCCVIDLHRNVNMKICAQGSLMQYKNRKRSCGGMHCIRPIKFRLMSTRRLLHIFSLFFTGIMQLSLEDEVLHTCFFSNEPLLHIRLTRG